MQQGACSYFSHYQLQEEEGLDLAFLWIYLQSLMSACLMV